MKIEKMSLRSIKNVLSRAEMKKIMAGGSGGTCAFSCNGFYGNQVYSMAYAQYIADQNVTSGRCSYSTWCCSSCP